MVECFYAERVQLLLGVPIDSLTYLQFLYRVQNVRTIVYDPLVEVEEEGRSGIVESRIVGRTCVCQVNMLVALILSV